MLHFFSARFYFIFKYKICLVTIQVFRNTVTVGVGVSFPEKSVTEVQFNAFTNTSITKCFERGG